MNEHYRRLFQEYERKRKRLMIRLNRRIRKIYQEIAEELPHPSQNEEIHLFTKRYQEAYRKAQNRHRKEITALISVAVVGISSKVRDREQAFVKHVIQNAEKRHGVTERKIPLSNFKTSPAIEKIINGKFYKDKFSLSDRIWNTDKKARERIDYIIQEGIRKGKSSLELAKDLEQFVNPDARKDWEWRKVYPNAGNTTIDYNAQRLARTAVMHAYQEQTRQSARENPFCKGIKWHSALIHNRTCELCESRHGRIYSPDDLPLDHPNGLCTMIPVIGDLREIGTTLGQMARGTYHPSSDGSENQKEKTSRKQEKVNKSSEKTARKGYNKISGAITDTLSKEAEEHAEMYYEEIRKQTTDVQRIAKNTGYSEQFIQEIKNYLFIDEHELETGKRRFDPDFAIAQSWQRLAQGEIKPHDLTLLKHEEMERKLIAQGLTQDEAHTLTSRIYNYDKESEEYYASLKEHQKRRK